MCKNSIHNGQNLSYGNSEKSLNCVSSYSLITIVSEIFLVLDKQISFRIISQITVKSSERSLSYSIQNRCYRSILGLVSYSFP